MADQHDAPEHSEYFPYSMVLQPEGHNSTTMVATGINGGTPTSAAASHAGTANSPHQPAISSSTIFAGVEDMKFDETPTRPSRAIKDQILRGRGLSRSSSVPNIMQQSMSHARHFDQSVSPRSNETGGNPSGGTRHSNSSVKHLTCFWWKEKGGCRFSDEDCLYAHHDTGHATDPPRQLVPGEPAMAGRKLDRAMRSLAIAAHRSSGSLNSMAGSRFPSRPNTPAINTESGTASNANFSSPLTSPLITKTHPQFADFDLARLNSDNQFLRTLVDQNGKEKAIMINTIEGLQAENKGMKGELEGLRKAQEQLLVEREGLHKRIQQIEQTQSQEHMIGRNINNPFGAIGRGRMNTETRYLGGLLTEE